MMGARQLSELGDVTSRDMGRQEYVPHIKAGAMPFLASKAVLALAYVAIFMPRKPDRMEVMAPSTNEMVENRPFRTSSARVRSPSGATDPRSEKIRMAMMTCASSLE